MPVTVRLVSAEIILVINEVESYAFINHLQQPDIPVLTRKVHVEICDILHLIFPLLSNAGILGQNDTSIIILLIKALGQ